MRSILQLLEKHYHSPVDTEFTIQILNPLRSQPEVCISLLQCRPQSHLQDDEIQMPAELPIRDLVFTTWRVVPRGHIANIRAVLFVTPEGYFKLPSAAARNELSRAISQLNVLLAKENYIAIGPGRWGTSNPDLGVHIGYSDIYNTCALVELAGEGVGLPPEASFGTHFFQDLVESNIHPLAVYLDDEEMVFSREFFYNTPNRLLDYLPEDQKLLDALRVIDVSSFRPHHHLELAMDDVEGYAVAYLSPDENADERNGKATAALSPDEIETFKE
jgi:hypothetical protein